MTPIRTRALDAAVELLASGGLRALTHNRIDERAGLPKGSTSNYFRTRDALLVGVANWIVERELPLVQDFLVPRSLNELVDAMCAILDATTRNNRTLTAARLVLFVEASHNLVLREALTQGRSAMEAAVVAALAGMGARDPQGAFEALAACSEGLILHRIARNVETDPRAIFETVIRGAIA